MCKHLVWKLQWWRIKRARRSEEFRLWAMTIQPGADDEDLRAWSEFKEENRVMGVW